MTLVLEPFNKEARDAFVQKFQASDYKNSWRILPDHHKIKKCESLDVNRNVGMCTAVHLQPLQSNDQTEQEKAAISKMFAICNDKFSDKRAALIGKSF